MTTNSSANKIGIYWENKCVSKKIGSTTADIVYWLSLLRVLNLDRKVKTVPLRCASIGRILS